MQGVILSAGRGRDLILGDDGNRYAFTLEEWQGEEAAPEAGMRVDFEVRGSAAVDIFPIPGAAPTPPAPMPTPPVPTPPAPPAPRPAPPAAAKAPPAEPASAPPARPAPPVASKALPAEPASAPPARPAPPAGVGFGTAWWHWALAVCALAVVAVVAAFALGLFGSSGAPVGKEIARHTYEGRTYVLVEYGRELAIFSAASGAPVGERGLAEGILRSYAWRQALGDFDAGGLGDVSAKVRRLDDSVSGVRGLSNDVVYIFDELDGMKARIPLLGSISAMDVVRESFSGVEEAEDLIRSLDSELNALGDNAASLTRASDRIRGVEPSSVSGDEMEALFGDAAEAASDLEGSVRAVRDFVSEATEAVGDLESALRAGSDTPIIGDALGDFARSVGRFESELSGLSGLLGGFESELGSLEGDMRAASDSAGKTFETDVDRWLAEPYDSEWPPADPARRPAGAAQPSVEEQRVSAPAARTVPTAAPAPDVAKPSVSVPFTGQSTVSGRQPFKLEWEVSESSVKAGEGFILTVRMYDVGRSGEHGGISVSFPSLGQSGGPKDWYSTSVADVEAVDYTSGLSNVTFHHPGATIYHRQGNRQFPADYLLVESDDPSWSSSSDRTLELLIVPKRAGEFRMQIRGWLCGDGYENCGRNPSEGSATDQQGWVVDRVSVGVVTPSAASAPTATSASTTTPMLTATSASTTTPVPTATSAPTTTPVPTAAPTPTTTPMPAAAPTPAATPVPADYTSDDFVGNLDSGWKLLGTAHHNPAGFIVLTEDRNDQTGVLIRKSPLLTERFSVDFSFEIGGGDCCDADGLAFFIARSVPESLKRHAVHHGHTFGSRDLNGVAVEFDTWQDWSFEQSGNHVGLTLLGESEPVRLVEKELDVELNNSGVFDATIVFDSGRVQVFLENATMGMGTTLVLDSTVATAYIPSEGHFGFVGVTGSWSDRHVIHSVHVQALDQVSLSVAASSSSTAPAPAPTLPPASGRIAFSSDRGENWDIYVMNADGSDVRRLTHNPATDGAPSWSPDGRRIAFHSHRDGNWNIYVMNADGSDEEQLTDNEANDEHPNWSSDGQRIVFHSNRGGDYETYVMNADGSGETRLTDNVWKDWHPHWSPDGRRNVFELDGDGDYELYVRNADGSGERRLTNNLAKDWAPGWSPDGRRIVFCSDRDGNDEIYVMNADGAGVRRLTDNTARDWEPSWSP